ncbi:hypothetical protein B0H16DRAFT_1513257 [Mycena metata]|uniref:Uncharacterized protein n=1 Tax=Mycena metata TaxID=1033252 RepID=A0AAD7JV27_9AGAR|nr:hypothetical protein B0H16DRAFT_1513257 [Mycena metata]
MLRSPRPISVVASASAFFSLHLDAFPMATSLPAITWYDKDGNHKQLPPSLDEFVHGENAYSLAHLELQPTTWELCTAYFDATLANHGIAKIEKDNQYWCWILPLTVDGGKAKLVATTSVEKLHVPFPIEPGKGSTLPAYGAPPTLFNPSRQVVDPSLKGSSLPMTTGITIIKSSPETVVEGLISYWKGNGKDMDGDLDYF